MMMAFITFQLFASVIYYFIVKYSQSLYFVQKIFKLEKLYGI